MESRILELKNVSKHFPVRGLGTKGFVHAMDDVSFHLDRGEILAIVGESGSGKTTTAKVISKIYSADGGEILFQDRDITGPMPRKELLRYRSRAQMIFQDPFGSLNPTHTIRAIMERPYIIHKLAERGELDEKIRDVLGRVGLEPPEQFLGKFPHELSGGQRQRISIARVLAINPDLIIADEPTSMLDVSIRMIIMNMIREIRDRSRISYLYITHDLAGARYIGDRIAVMYAGMIMEIGRADEVIRETGHPYTELLKSAAPQPENSFRGSRLTASGEIPSLINPPAGCRFHPRCPHARRECSLAVPPMKEIAPGHSVRCIL